MPVYNADFWNFCPCPTCCIFHVTMTCKQSIKLCFDFHSAKNLRLLRMPRQYITMPELIKELKVPPKKRTERACKNMASALYAFIRQINEFKVGQYVL